MHDLLVKNGMVFTYIHEGYHALKLRQADILIKNGVIVKIAPDISESCEELDAAGCMVLPGMINMGSASVASKLLAGLLPDQRAVDGTLVHTRVLPVVDAAAEMLDDEALNAVALCALWDGLSGGTTTAVDICPPRFATAVKKAGDTLEMRLFRAVTACDRTAPRVVNSLPVPGRAILAQGIGLGDYPAIFSFETASDMLAQEVAGTKGPRFAGAAYSASESGRPIKKLSDMGFLSAGTVLWQCVYADARDRELMAWSGSSAALSAVTCAQEGKKYPAVDFLRSGINTALMTGFYGNCMISEMRAAAFAAKQAEGDAAQYQATDALYAATVAGARALGMQDTLGRVDMGMSGDVSVVSMARFEPLSYPFIQYLYGAAPSDVRHVACRGRVIKKDYAPADFISASLQSAVTAAQAAVQAVWQEAIARIL
ncbi:MAG: amidohydrolase family protein [Oscillospiraceae bacterium]|jgi:5-methylthioadenosine/S-adenosylhomocysteine deaminase|nr:amidohydrolase family protein [Oscillospiraceae bacterium]